MNAATECLLVQLRVEGNNRQKIHTHGGWYKQSQVVSGAGRAATGWQLPGELCAAAGPQCRFEPWPGTC